GGKTALVGTQLAADRINKSGGINGRPVELVVADYESKPDVGRRKAEKLLVEDKVDIGEGGYLSNVCIACMPVFEEQKTVSMIGADGKPFDGIFAIMFGANAVTFTTQAYDLGLLKKAKYAGDGAVAESTHLTALGQKVEGFTGINRYIPVLVKPLDTPHHKKFFEESKVLLKKMDPSGPDPDRYVQSNFEAMNFLKLGIQKSGFRGRTDKQSIDDWKKETMKLVEALE